MFRDKKNGTAPVSKCWHHFLDNWVLDPALGCNKRLSKKNTNTVIPRANSAPATRCLPRYLPFPYIFFKTKNHLFCFRTKFEAKMPAQVRRCAIVLAPAPPRASTMAAASSAATLCFVSFFTRLCDAVAQIFDFTCRCPILMLTRSVIFTSFHEHRSCFVSFHTH